MKLVEVSASIRSGWFGFKYVIRHQLGASAPPLIRGLVLTNRCNLRCRHCRVAERGPMDLQFAEVAAQLKAFHSEGGRCLYLEGGEPFLWHDGPQGLEDVVAYAHGLGFLTVVVYTNGTLPIQTSADTVFVSVDGLRNTHDALRGKSFDRIMGHIGASAHEALYVNYTINNRNKDEICAFCEYVDGVEHIRGTFFYFHTPYYGYDELYVEPPAKRRVLQELLELRKDYRILNSRAGLQSALRNDWKRPLPCCSVYEQAPFTSVAAFGGIRTCAATAAT